MDAHGMSPETLAGLEFSPGSYPHKKVRYIQTGFCIPSPDPPDWSRYGEIYGESAQYSMLERLLDILEQVDNQEEPRRARAGTVLFMGMVLANHPDPLPVELVETSILVTALECIHHDLLCEEYENECEEPLEFRKKLCHYALQIGGPAAGPYLPAPSHAVNKREDVFELRRCLSQMRSVVATEHGSMQMRRAVGINELLAAIIASPEFANELSPDHYDLSGASPSLVSHHDIRFMVMLHLLGLKVEYHNEYDSSEHYSQCLHIIGNIAAKKLNINNLDSEEIEHMLDQSAQNSEERQRKQHDY